jgi:hypothetical protein
MLARLVALVLSLCLAIAVGGHAFSAKTSFSGQASAQLYRQGQIACCNSVEEVASGRAKSVHANTLCSIDLACFGPSAAVGGALEHRGTMAMIDRRRDGLQPRAPKKPPRVLS